MLRDARYAIRLLLRRPVFAVSAILTLAFCIGANTAIYTVVDRLRQPILILWGAVEAVLLIGCVNVAGLLIARGAERAPEFAMRLALGGGRAAIVRQLLIESVVLALCGGALGIGIGYVGSRAFGSLLGDAFGVTAQLTLDGRILAITAATALATSVAFGLLPAVQSARVNLRETLVASGSG